MPSHRRRDGKTTKYVDKKDDGPQRRSKEGLREGSTEFKSPRDFSRWGCAVSAPPPPVTQNKKLYLK